MVPGIVIIGRNEGQRLVRCLESLAEHRERCVYVDSGSTDGSVEAARSRGVDVLLLDMALPFTAARARNAGFHRLLQRIPGIEAVHFFDGDCEVQPGWLASATALLEQRADVGVVFGVQKERFPGRSIYNALFDIEWDTPRGAVASCAGNALCRRELFERLEGFREALIAGEDPEFCLRVRRSGYLVWHLDTPMVLHDADMMHLSQWWRRTMRGGYAFAAGAALHGAAPERHFVREARSAAVWGLLLPVVIMLLSILVSKWLWLLLLVYPLQMLRVSRHGRRDSRSNLLYGIFTVLAKFPEGFGVLKFLLARLRGGTTALIEYK